MRPLPPYLDVRERPDGKWDVWANLPDPILGPINVKCWQIVAVCNGGRHAYNTAMTLHREWRNAKSP